MNERIAWARALFAVVFVAVAVFTLNPRLSLLIPIAFAAVRRWRAFAVALLGAGAIAVGLKSGFFEWLFEDAAHADKIVHFIAYGILGASAFAGRLAPMGSLAATPFLLAIYGALLEAAQIFTGGRSADIVDGLANGFGALAGFVLAAMAALAATRVRRIF